MEWSLWVSRRAEALSETVLKFCKLCRGSGNICVLCVLVAAGSLVVSPNTLQQLVHFVLVHGTWHTVMLRGVCWLLQNVKYSRLKTFNVTEYVCVCKCVFVLVWSTIWYTLLYFLKQKIYDRLQCCHKHRLFNAHCSIIWNTDHYTEYHTVTVHISDTVSAVAMWH